MNRSEFIRILRKELDRLPQDEIDAAVEYYEEYFDEAGPDKEAEIIKELGNPRKIANQIRSEYEVRRLDEEEKSTTRKGLSAVWWVIIGICSAPVSIPVAVVLVALAVAGFAVADTADVASCKDAKITITAYAIQADGFDTASAAWTAGSFQ